MYMLHKLMKLLIITECFESYGKDCKIPCSKHCYNKHCEKFNGTCLTGCINQFYVDKCDKGIIVPYLLCKICQQLYNIVRNGIAFIKDIIARKKNVDALLLS